MLFLKYCFGGCNTSVLMGMIVGVCLSIYFCVLNMVLLFVIVLLV